MSRRQTAGEIEAEAAHWVLRLDREGRTTANLAELEAWLMADTRRQGALLQAEATWTRLDRATLLAATTNRPRLRLRRRVSRRAVLAGVGTAIAASTASLVILHRADRYRTTLGEIRRVPLTDGSIMAINTQSDAQVDVDERRRRVRLQRGEVWLQVAKDASRPFVVEAGMARAQAVGTAFSVRRRSGGVDVNVTEGVVRAWVVGDEGGAIELGAGSRAFLADTAEITMQEDDAPEIDRKLAWRSGRIDLAGEPLGRAADEFNRYNARKVVVAPALADNRLYGVFRVDDPEGFAVAVGASLNARVELTPTAIILDPQ